MSNYYDLIKKGLSGAVNVAAGAVSKAAEVAKDLAEDLTSVKALKDYKLAGHVATAGPGNTWKIYNAVSKKPGALFPEAAVWVLDKKQMIDQASRGGRARGFDQFFEQQRRGCGQLLRIKHPGVLKVLEQLEETSNQMVMVTEPVFGSLHNLQSHFRDVANSTPERSSAKLSQLEIKYGMMHVAETVQFLHQEAKLVHCNLSPGSLIVTKDGSWKLSGFAFVASCDFGGAQGQMTSFEYVSSQPAPWEEYIVPPLAYTAPEMLAGSMAGSEQRLHPASDVFSLAAITYELVKGKPLLPVGSSLGEYRSRLSMLSGVDMSGVPGPLQATLTPMMASAAAARPNAAAFASCQWFQEDMLLRALRFLDGILQRESSQKVAFLKDLSTFWQQFDERLLLHKILPPIVQEMRNEMVSLAALPMVLAIMSKMTPEQFRDSGILPVLKPVFDTADGELLLALVRHLQVFHKLMTGDAVATTLLPLLLRACDSASTKTQEEVLRGLRSSALDLPYQLLRDALMPKVIAMCLRTTSLVVRCAALGLMTQAVPRLDKEAALAMVDVAGKVLAVDKSAGTAMAVLALGEAVAKHYGTEVAAQLVLPMLCPMLVAPTLSNQQFAACMGAMRGMLDAIQEKRGTDVTAVGNGTGAGGGSTAPSTPMGTASGGANSTGLGSSGASSMSSWSAAVGSAGSSTPTADGLGAAAVGGGGGSSWQSAVSYGTSTSSSRPAAQPAPSSSWSDAAMGSSWAAPSTSSNTSSSSHVGHAGGSGGWGASWPAGASSAAAPAGVKPGAPAPDIFSDPSSGLGGLSLSSTPAFQQQQQQQQVGGLAGGTTDSDLFGGLSMRAVSPAGAPAGNSSGSSRPSWSSGPPQQQQQQQRPASLGAPGFGLQPPPSAKTSIGATNLVSTSTLNSSSTSQDPFAMLSSGPPAAAPSPWQTAAAAPAAPLSGSSASFDPFAPTAAAAGDPFSSLSGPASSRPMGGAPAAAGGVDPFASLAAGGKPMGMAQQKAQQQQQWGGSGGSLI